MRSRQGQAGMGDSTDGLNPCVSNTHLKVLVTVTFHLLSTKSVTNRRLNLSELLWNLCSPDSDVTQENPAFPTSKEPNSPHGFQPG